jgi:vacuolar-type H+-ATPase subunit C/Vma6
VGADLLDTRYPFFSAYLKGEEARLITSSHINRMSKASGLRDIVEVIKETDIGDYLDRVPVDTFAGLDEHLWIYFGECVRRIEWFKPVPADMLKILKAYIVKYDVLNIKMAAQAISSGGQFRKIPIGAIHNQGLLDALSSAENADDIIELLNRCQLGSYAQVLEKSKIDESTDSRLRTESRLDGEYYRGLLNMTKGITEGALLAKAFGILIDVKNLQVVLRVIIENTGPEAAEYIIDGGYMLSPEVIKELSLLKLDDIPGRVEYLYRDMTEEVVGSYNRTRSITVVEEITEKYKFMLAKEILSPKLLSPLMIAWYLIIKEIEIRNVRIILKAVYDNISVEEIRNYLVLPS